MTRRHTTSPAEAPAQQPAQPGERGTVLVAHPSPDLYGSDRQLVQVAGDLIDNGWRVVVHLPAPGPLVALLQDSGAEVRFTRSPVLRRSSLRPLGFLALMLAAPLSVARLWWLIRTTRPDAVYVNTVTVPVWLVAARLARRPTLCHVREAEDAAPRLVRIGLAAPLMLADTVLTNSHASRHALITVIPRLARRTRVVYNGITAPRTEPTPPTTPTPGTVTHIALVARLSPRKGIDIALDALAQVLTQGHHVHLDICGTVFTGYDWYETELRTRADQPDLAGHVTFHGYVNPTWPILDTAGIVIVPSRVEPFGNTAVEGMLAHRPVIASDVQGLAEIIDHNRTGLLVPPADPTALAHAITTLLDNPDHATHLATTGRHDATTRFSTERYRREMSNALEESIRR